MYIVRNQTNEFRIFNEIPVRQEGYWIVKYDAYEDYGLYLADAINYRTMKWEDDPIEVDVVVPVMDKFETCDDINKFINEHLSQKTEKELSYLSSLSKTELYRQGLFEGITNGLLYAGVDVTEIAGMEPMIEK